MIDVVRCRSRLHDVDPEWREPFPGYAHVRRVALGRYDRSREGRQPSQGLPAAGVDIERPPRGSRRLSNHRRVVPWRLRLSCATLEPREIPTPNRSVEGLGDKLVDGIHDRILGRTVEPFRHAEESTFDEIRWSS